jgi:hypothetical protein
LGDPLRVALEEAGRHANNQLNPAATPFMVKTVIRLQQMTTRVQLLVRFVRLTQAWVQVHSHKGEGYKLGVAITVACDAFFKRLDAFSTFCESVKDVASELDGRFASADVLGSVGTFNSFKSILYDAWGAECEKQAQALEKVVPSASVIENRMILKDATIYNTLVSSVQEMTKSDAFKAANDTLKMVKGFEDKCGPWPKDQPSASVALSRLRRERHASRRAIGYEWAVTCVRGFKPTVQNDIQLMGADISKKLSLKGLKLEDMPPTLRNTVQRMIDYKPPPTPAIQPSVEAAGSGTAAA